MTLESDLHDELAGFSDEVVAVLEAGGFWDLPEGQYDPVQFYAGIPKKDIDAYKKESAKKNSRVWDLVKGAIIGTAISSGISAFQKEYKAPKKPSAQDLMNDYIKTEGGKFITNMGRTDQNKLVGFIWSNAGQDERVLAKMIQNQPYLRQVLDQGKHRTETIVRTEKFRATEFGTFRSAQNNKFSTKTRITAGDKRVRPSHRALNQITVGIDDPFPNGEYYPGENSINCRCRVRYGFDLNKIDKNAAKTYADNVAAYEKQAKAERAAARKVAPRAEPRTVAPNAEPRKVAPKAEPTKISPMKELKLAKSLSDVQAWAEKYHPEHKWVLGHGDIDNVKTFVRTFDAMSKQFPQIKKGLTHIGSTNDLKDNEIMAVLHFKSGTRQLLYNNKYMNDPKLNELKARQKKSGYTATGSINGSTAHECGHLLDAALSEDTAMAKKISEFKATHKATATLSRYAMKDDEEAWAEGIGKMWESGWDKDDYTDAQADLLKELGVL